MSIGWLKALRLPTSLMAGLLAVVSFKQTAWTDTALYLGVFTVIAASATMVLNDWFDRQHDAKKGKTFAETTGKKFAVFAVSLWLIVLVMSLPLYGKSIPLGIMTFFMMILGISYSFTRKIHMLPTVHVATASAAVALYPVAFYQTNYSRAWLLAGMTFMVIFGREILKDLQDHPDDIGYKKTLPQIAGVTGSKMISGAAIVLGAILSLVIHLWAVILLPVLGAAIIFLALKQQLGVSKMLISLSMMTYLVLMLI
ncbi:hypothetical protein C4561_02640 [candidate division WWE3 bacterium]|jgi:4-hydroxybenzoate polyprenyltransferase|uniref:Prenyltransferase n=1 Tax=candidate division WWE3 bacterium TaxID=2053526 RepID=A0A3A4ZDL9_UNCKA|nr:MAG: hypothetical protein C4561_02640 [candidate division WWE3 bacterium]